MIQETKKRMYFVEYIPQRGRERDTDAPPIVRVSVKNGTIIFGARAMAILGMEEKFIKFFYDSGKRMIAFTLTQALSEEMLSSKKYRLVKAMNNKAGTKYLASVAGIVKEFKGLKEDSYKCEVKKYVEHDALLDRGITYYYVELNDIVNSKDLV